MSDGSWWVVATASLAALGSDVAAAGRYGPGVILIVAAIGCGVIGIVRLGAKQ